MSFFVNFYISSVTISHKSIFLRLFKTNNCIKFYIFFISSMHVLSIQTKIYFQSITKSFNILISNQFKKVRVSKIIKTMTPITPPPNVRGMTVLNRELFTITVKVPALRIKESRMSSVTKYIKQYLLKIEKFKPVQSECLTLGISNGDESSLSSMKIAYLNPLVIKSWDDINLYDREGLSEWDVSKESFLLRDVSLGYENWKAEEIFKAVLPSDKENLTSFSIIGHIVHVNLKSHHLEYKKLIGQVFLDKVKDCKTVVNKTNNIDNKYRNFTMEVLCGESNFQAVVKENKCCYEFDFSLVYWNPRLCTEHERIVALLKPGDILFDIFAGVGPFSIPALRKKCLVYANDLNPDSYKWLCHNAKLNKVVGSSFKAYNMDGRCFITDVIAPYFVELLEKSETDDQSDIHITMNLPALAVEFLNTFIGLLKGYTLKNLAAFKEPVVHIYCFALENNPVDVARQMVEEKLQYKLDAHMIGIFNVRNVSPKKEMMRVSFRLSKNMLLGIKDDSVDGDKETVEDNYEPCSKFPKLEN